MSHLIKVCNYRNQWVWEAIQLTPSKQTTLLVGVDMKMAESIFSDALEHVGHVYRRRWGVLVKTWLIG